MQEIIKILENKLSMLDLTSEDKEQLSDICKKLNIKIYRYENIT